MNSIFPDDKLSIDPFGGQDHLYNLFAQLAPREDDNSLENRLGDAYDMFSHPYSIGPLEFTDSYDGPSNKDMRTDFDIYAGVNWRF